LFLLDILIYSYKNYQICVCGSILFIQFFEFRIKLANNQCKKYFQKGVNITVVLAIENLGFLTFE